MATELQSARSLFRVLTQTRTGSADAIMHDVQLQVVATGAIVWAHTFSDADEAERRRHEVEQDLDRLDEDDFRRKWSVPSST